MRKIQLNLRGLIFTMACIALVIAVNLRADDYSKKAAAKDMGTTRFLIQVPHTLEDCMQSLDEVKAMGNEKLSKWSWGCMTGDHTAYMIVEVKDEATALNWVPANERSKAKVEKLTVFTPEQIKEMHAMKK